MFFLIWKHHQKDNGITPHLLDGYLKAKNLEDAKKKLNLSFELLRIVQNKQVTGYKKTKKHKTVFYIVEAKKPVCGEEISLI